MSGQFAATSLHLEGEGHGWFARPHTAVPSLRASGPVPVLRKAELALASQGRAVARRAVRVPADAFVAVRTRPALAAPVRPLALPPASTGSGPVPAGAGAVLAPSRGSRILRIVLREAIAFALLAATLAAVYYAGRLHALQNVIVVPEPWSDRTQLG